MKTMWFAALSLCLAVGCADGTGAAGNVSAARSGGAGDQGDGDGECENGVDASTGKPCTDDEGDGDGECENGVDENGKPCTDDDGKGDGDGEEDDD